MTEKEYTEFNRKMNELEEKCDYSGVINLILSLSKDDLNDDIVSSLGRAYNNDQQFDKAYETLMSVRESQKEKANWHYRLGYALYYLRRFDESLERFENALKIYVEDEDCVEWIDTCKREIETLKMRKERRLNYTPNKNPFEGFDFTDFWDDCSYSQDNYIEEHPTDEIIAETEAKLGYKLPQSYIRLCRMHNGGMINKGCCPCNESTSWSEEHVGVTGIMGIGFNKTYSICGELGSQFMIDEWNYPNIGVAICDCPSAGHDMIFLDYSLCGPQGEPEVVHIDQEGDYKITWLANDFEEFICMLFSEDEENEDNEKAVADFDLPASYTKFWNWFQKNEKSFWSVVKNKENIENDFFDLMAPELKEIKEGIFHLVGMIDDTVDLIFTADGNSKNIVFVEELVAAAPKIDGWKFSAHKPAFEGWNVKMSGYDFGTDNISFYPNELPQYPDEIDITIVHNELIEENRKEITNGTYIFLDNYLGEIEFLTKVDTINIIGKEETQDNLIPITKLKSFLDYRQKEFVEKYDGFRYNTQDDNYSMLEANLKNGNKLLAIVNAELLNWDSKASHPWIATLILKYEKDGGGMPNKKDYNRLNSIEDETLVELKDYDGYLNIGRQTANGEREIYFACKDFRKPAKIFFQIKHKYSNRFEIEYEIYKDKYWQSFNRFIVG